MAANCPRLRVQPPAVTPYAGGLFSVAQMPVEPASDNWQCGVEYETDACAEARVWTDSCQEDPEPKIPDAVRSLVTGDPFVVYAGPECDLVGSTLQRIRDSARNALELGEQRAVERAFWTGELPNGATVWPSLAGACCEESPAESPAEESPGESRCCADGAPCCQVLNRDADGNPIPYPTRADALSLPGGVGALEEYAANNYAGTAIIHAPRGLSAFASAANQLCVCGNGALSTALGTRWAFYGLAANTGPCGQPAPAGTAWMFVTGTVTIRRSDIFMTPPDDQLVAGVDLRHNKATVLAERTYVITRECLCAAVLVSASCQC